MRRLALPALVFLAAAVAVARPDDEPGRQFALVVGAQKYDAADELTSLRFAEKDATAFARVLRDAGFRRVVLMTRAEMFKAQDESLKPTGANIRAHLAAILKGLRPADTVVIAFAGHGVEPKGAKGLHFCPEDARLGDRSTLIPLTEVYAALEKCPAGVKLLVADACRNDPLSGKAPVVNDLQSVTRPEVPVPPGGVVGLFGCSQGQKAFESPKREHSFLFHYLIEGLKGKAAGKDGAVDVLALANYAASEVPEAVKDELGPLANQVPELTGTVRGRVVLVRPKGVAKPKQLKLDLGGGVTMEFVRIPAGTFLMGAPDGEDADPDERPQHRVRISKDFYLGKYEVTQRQYQALMGVNPSKFKDVAGEDTAHFPVEMVSWEDAMRFCAALERKTGKTAGLPTEAEWEYACRAGTTTAFHFGDVLDGTQANCDGKYPYGTSGKGPYLKRPCKVGSYRPNAFGLHDMHGNVWEWCADWYGEKYYNELTNLDPKGPSSGSARVFRGGSYLNGCRDGRAASRLRDPPYVRVDFYGFRAALRLD